MVADRNTAAWVWARRHGLALWDVVCDTCGCDCPPVFDECTGCTPFQGDRFRGVECLSDCLHLKLLQSTLTERKALEKAEAKVRREEIFRREDGICPICGDEIRSVLDAEIDHMVPFCNGGTDDDFNLFPVHRDCHKIKSKRDMEGFRYRREAKSPSYLEHQRMLQLPS